MRRFETKLGQIKGGPRGLDLRGGDLDGTRPSIVLGSDLDDPWLALALNISTAGAGIEILRLGAIAGLGRPSLPARVTFLLGPQTARSLLPQGISKRFHFFQKFVLHLIGSSILSF